MTDARAPDPPHWMTHPSGSFDRRVLDQDEFWVPVDGRPRHLADLEDDHVAALVPWLGERALQLHLDAMLDTLVDALAGRALPEILALEVTGISLASLTPEEWLETTALMRGIRRELRRRQLTAGEDS